VEAKVVDPETGEDLGRNQPGELLLRSSLIMKEYWKRPEATVEALSADGWFNVRFF
jgi:fatty-acyl-CoA synthase